MYACDGAVLIAPVGFQCNIEFRCSNFLRSLSSRSVKLKMATSMIHCLRYLFVDDVFKSINKFLCHFLMNVNIVASVIDND